MDTSNDDNNNHDKGGYSNDDDLQQEQEQEQQHSAKKPSKQKPAWPGDNDETTVSSPSPLGWMKALSLSFQRYTYQYMNHVMNHPKLHNKKQEEENENDELTLEDLVAIPRNIQAERLAEDFRQYYQQAVHSAAAAAASTKSSSSEKEEETESPSSQPPQSFRRLLSSPLSRSLWRLAAPSFIPAGFNQVVSVICQVTLPLVVRQLLLVLERDHYNNNNNDDDENNDDNNELLRKGLPYAVIMFLLLVADALATHRHRHLALHAGIVLRATMVQVLYQHVLHLSPQGRKRGGLSSGQVGNLIAVDTQKLFEVTQEGHLSWSLPLSVISATLLLVFQTSVGPTSLVGIAVLIGFVPVVERVTAAMMRLRRQRVICTDARIAQINAMLQGIKTTKLNHYETQYHERVMQARNTEHAWLQKELATWAMTLCITVSSPVLAAGATFAVYALTGDNHILTASESFSVLLFFNILRFPINFAGRWMGKAAQAYSALERIEAFLQREIRDEEDTNSSYDSSKPLIHPLVNSNNTSSSNNNHHGDHDDNVKENNNHDQPSQPVQHPLVLKNAVFRIGKDLADPELLLQQSNHSTPSSSRQSSTRSIQSSRSFRRGKKSNPEGDDNKSDVQPKQEKPAFEVSEFNLTVQKGQVLAVCGPVGCGKTTLIHGIIQEVDASPETVVRTNGRVAFVPQTPFIINATLRENILFGRPYKRELFERVLEVCCLGPDIEQLGHARDLTEIGERGVTLSGGQKQRVSLARAAYSEPDLVLLDDPLSALDAGTAKRVFERLIKSSSSALSGTRGATAEKAFFANAAVVLVTHASHFLNRVDQILVMVDGRNEFLGTWEDLSTFQTGRIKTQSAIEFIRLSVQEEEEEEQNSGDADESTSHRRGKTQKQSKENQRGTKDGVLMTVEEREHGLSSMNTWLLWFQRAGGAWFFSIQVLFLSIDRFAYVSVEYWLARWTDGAKESIDELGVTFEAQTEGRSAQSKYVIVYMILVAWSIFTTVLRSEWVVTGGWRAGKAVFESMLTRVLSAPLSYFETTPMGRVVNRFTYDMEVIDVTLTMAMSMFIIATGWGAASVAVIMSILPWMGFAIAPVCAGYWFLLLHYRRSATDLQRLDALSRSPVQAMIGEGLEGSTTIRVFRQKQSFLSKYRSRVDDNSTALLNFVSAQRWVGLRIQVAGSIIVLASSVLVVVLNETMSIDPGLVGLLIIWSSNFTITLGYLVETFSEAEASITAIERVNAMSSLPQERAMETDEEAKPPISWPETGAVEFKDVCLRYRKGLPLALNHLSFKIPGGKRCGVVGRTGAGKSSLTVALFRLVEIESGSIMLDGVDLATLGLADVRGRSNGMSIIPQDPFLAGRTIRECLDPFDLSRDEDILEALDAVRLSSVTLQTPVEEGGSNFSVGERQLLNLARQLLFKPRVLVLDESTASIDGETDAFIQAMLRTRFQETTLLTVAHRLNTIMDYDLILVMDAGQAVELGSPADLLDQNGVFAELVDATGPEGSKALRAMVV